MAIFLIWNTNPEMIILLILISWVRGSMQLVCNYCYQADIKEDCHLNVINCQPEHVCSVETSLVTYEGKGHKEQKYRMYKMGCEHYSLCRDRVSSGVGPYGYSVVTKICCCSQRCEDPDGVGKGVLDHCPMLWSNFTEVSDGPATCDHPRYLIWILLLLLAM